MRMLSIVAVVLILAGVTGVISKKIKNRIIGITLDSLGMLLLANCQGQNLGFYAGVELLFFNLPVLILFLIMISHVVKKYEYEMVSDFINFRKNQQYLFVLFVVMGVMLIGLPGTGAFAAYMMEMHAIFEWNKSIEEAANVSSQNGFYSCLSVIGFGLGILLLTIQFLDLWIHMLLVSQTENTVQPTKKKKSLAIITVFLLAFVVLGIMQIPVLDVLNSLYKLINK